MKVKTVLIAALSLALAGAAGAADLPAKAAAPANAFQYPQTSGLYWGLGVEGAAGPANVTSTTPGTNPSSLVTDQAGVFGIVGYVWNVPNTSMFTAAEGWFGWTNFNGSTPGFSFSGPAAFKQRLLVGAPTDQILAMFPNIFGNLTPPPFVVPAGQSILNTKGYLAAAINENDVSANFAAGKNSVWTVTPEIDLGVLAAVSTGTVIDAYGFVKLGDRAICVGAVANLAGGCANMQPTYGGAIAFKW
jgi:hypothetical protein